ncbi:phage integrase family protein [Massilia sp. CCM 8734]|uniref:phage integrase family protein n=1 Tax=Massilia sp. CCM 8734 TaxID=2609283 RepID=UPI0014202866|nr:phage integrase family protein [Massilia sp. CCM 8734]NHZ99079.1 tyrosine-type recombinase/integrase [Massilia sp. CCM 8734]
MAQNTNVVLPELRYTRSDFTALRAYCLKLPIGRIGDLYYSDDSPQIEYGLERYLVEMRDALVERAIEINPGFAESLTHARKTGHVPAKMLDILVQAADLRPTPPSPADSVAKWFRPRTVKALRAEGVATIADLVGMVNRRGASWWRSVPRIGVRRAAVVLRWLRNHEEQLGEIVAATQRAMSPAKLRVLEPSISAELVPLGYFYLPPRLDGHDGTNRAPAFCFISARDDLAAIDCYLARFEGQAHTQRAYRKELERFVLWSVHVAGKPLSSLLVDECEAYKRFLTAPPEAFCGAPAPRSSKLWRPFVLKKKDRDPKNRDSSRPPRPLAPASQKFALTVLRAAFDYWVKVRYLGGNPWTVVKDPIVVQEVDNIQVDRALSLEGWSAVVDTLTRRGQVDRNVQDRVALAAILLMGDSGLRREEAARAMRLALRPSQHARGVWILTALGKRSKKRLVPVSPRAVAALQAHWRDLGLDFLDPADDAPLFSPVVVPATPAAAARHGAGMARPGYTANAIYALVKSALSRVRRELEAVDPDSEAARVTVEDIEQLASTSPHAFRHTFGSIAVDKDMPLNVVQEILGHEDSATTAIYVKAREKRLAAEAARLYGEPKDPEP